MSRCTPSTAEERAKVRSMVAKSMTAKQIAAETGRSAKSIVYMVCAYELGPWRGKSGMFRDLTHIPEDFAEQHGRMTQTQLAAHYGRSGSTISLWVRRAGLLRPKTVKINKTKKPPVSKIEIKPICMGKGGKSAVVNFHRDMSRVGLAVEFLRSLSPVSRCRADGILDPKGSYWRRGSAVFNDEQVVERADEIRARAERMAA